VPVPSLHREAALVEGPIVVVHAPFVHVDPARLGRRPEPRGDAGEPPAEAVVSGDAAILVPPECGPTQRLVSVRALLASVDPLPVVRGDLTVAVSLEELAGGTVHFEVLPDRRQLGPAPGELRPARQVQLVVGDVADTVPCERLEVALHG